jgi:hypothetical protein
VKEQARIHGKGDAVVLLAAEERRRKDREFYAERSRTFAAKTGVIAYFKEKR